MSEARVAYPNPALANGLFLQTTTYALQVWEHNQGNKALEPLEFLAGAEYPDNNSALEGATYRSLAYVAHRTRMNDAERQDWYAAARAIGFSQAHVGIIIARLNERDAMFSDLDKLVMAETA